MPIRLSASELRQLGTHTQKQQQNVQDVSKAGESAVNMASSGWQSTAFETFKTRWQADRGKLNQLSQELARWQKQCNQHSQVAEQVNRPFA